MAWITSATSGGAMAKCQWTLLRAGLLLAHLAFLGAIWRDRSARAETHVGDLATPDTASLALHPASFALLTGLLLALTLVIRPGFVPPRRLTAAFGRTPSPDQPTCEIVAPVHHAAASGLPVEAHAGLMARLNHDLRTPLNAMLGFADMMKVEAFGPLGDVRYRDYAAHKIGRAHV